MSKLMYQCRLESDNKVLITWLSGEKPFKVGDFVTLKDSYEPKRKWKVTTKGKGHPMSDVKDKWTSQDLKRDGTRKKLLS